MGKEPLERPLFSKEMRNRMSIYLQTVRKEGRHGMDAIQTGINLILDALLEM